MSETIKREKLLDRARRELATYERVGRLTSSELILALSEAERELAEARAEIERWAEQALKEEDCRKMWQAERDRLAAELAEERARPKLKIKRVERQPLVVDEPAWPNGCYSLSSCSRHLACMYHGCRHEGRNVKPEIEVAIAARASLQNGEKGE